ncbi:hypothetical protein [Bradyrhizobium manausense]|uniref:hypothetical protein n=1 Tax=Bradyrhizobium manausense TaxID=989370 RepID=UPI001FDA85EC|nr:hypothetical protein [Bradyrhizobium manausense]
MAEIDAGGTPATTGEFDGMDARSAAEVEQLAGSCAMMVKTSFDECRFRRIVLVFVEKVVPVGVV